MFLSKNKFQAMLLFRLSWYHILRLVGGTRQSAQIKKGLGQREKEKTKRHLYNISILYA